MHSDAQHTLILSCADVQQIISHYGLNQIMDALIERLERAISSFDSAQIITPARSGFHYDAPESGLVEWMPLYINGKQVTIKVVGYHPANPRKFNLPTIMSTISAYDTSTGHLLGIMDGVLPTALRTGAATAVASKYLAHPESSTLGIIGCGAQAVTQIHALSRIFNLKEILIYDTDTKAVDSLSARCQVLDLEATFIASPIDRIVSEADILVTATSIDVGAGPLFSGLPSKNHLHINAVGSDFPGKTELPLDFLQNSLVCPDFHAQAIVEGECQQLDANQIGPDLVTLIQNQQTYNEVPLQRTVFDSTGWALEDQIVLELFLEYAHVQNLGLEIELENMSGDVSNPYDLIKVPQPSKIDI